MRSYIHIAQPHTFIVAILLQMYKSWDGKYQLYFVSDGTQYTWKPVVRVAA